MALSGAEEPIGRGVWLSSHQPSMPVAIGRRTAGRVGRLFGPTGRSKITVFGGRPSPH